MLQFTAINEGRKQLTLMDITKREQSGLPEDIRSLTLTIVGSTIPGYKIVDIDVLNYMLHHRVSNELFIITSATLGLGQGANIPDGIYKLELKLNNTIFARETVAFYAGINEALDMAAHENEFDIEVTQEGYSFKTNGDKQKCELLAIAYALYWQLMGHTVKENEVAINDSLDKLKRILTLVKPDYLF